MEIWEKYFEDFYEKLDTLKEKRDKKVSLLYDREGKRRILGVIVKLFWGNKQQKKFKILQALFMAD